MIDLVIVYISMRGIFFGVKAEYPSLHLLVIYLYLPILSTFYPCSFPNFHTVGDLSVFINLKESFGQRILLVIKIFSY